MGVSNLRKLFTFPDKTEYLNRYDLWTVNKRRFKLGWEGNQGAEAMCPGELTVTTEDNKMVGSTACYKSVRVDNGTDLAVHNYMNLTAWSSNTSDKDYLRRREYDGHPTWPTDTYTRMVIWVRTPPGLPAPKPDATTAPNNKTFTLGTYIRTPPSPTSSDPDRYCIHWDEENISANDHAKITNQESPLWEKWDITQNGQRVVASGQGHFYHNYRLSQGGVWTQLIWDLRPNTMRQSTNFCPSTTQYPYADYEGVADHNYFDCLTEFYMTQYKYPDTYTEIETDYPAVWLYDNFLLYTDDSEPPGTEELIGSLCGSYRASDNNFHIGWAVRQKAWHVFNDVPVYDVQIRRAYEDIHALGWDNATTYPEVVLPNPNRAANMMDININDIDIPAELGRDPQSNDCMYFALKASTETDHTVFRQIVIPLIDGELPPHLQGAT